MLKLSAFIKRCIILGFNFIFIAFRETKSLRKNWDMRLNVILKLVSFNMTFNRRSEGKLIVVYRYVGKEKSSTRMALSP